MSLIDLQLWLVNDCLRNDLENIARLLAVQEIDNLTPSPELADVKPDWPRLVVASSILARSDDRRFREPALLVATAAVTMGTSDAIKDAAGILLDQLSNHRALSLAERREQIRPGLVGRLGTTMRLEAERRRFEGSVLLEASGDRLRVNDFQRRFWDGASRAEGWLSASAPTASGKTFLLLQWLLDQIETRDLWVAVYIAPTRALVSEVEEGLRLLLKARSSTSADVSSLPSIERYSAAVSRTTRQIFVLTQERLHLLFNLLSDTLLVDLLVVDEAHKIGDNQRGVVLQDAIERVGRANQKVRVVFISPATQNPGTLLEDAPTATPTAAVDSDVPTVLQNVIEARQAPGKPKVWELSLRRSLGQSASLGLLQLSKSPTGVRKRLAFVAASAGQRGGTLVYANGQSEAETIALLIKQLLPADSQIDPELAALADLARKGVHRDYALAPLVERGVAFHYGNMPSLIRLEIERLFRTGKINFLVCTSTLVEGVNLACRTIVVRGPRKGQGTAMEPHDFWNLAGRAGRWGNEFQGNIVCVDPDDRQAWPNGVPERARYPIRRETDSVMDGFSAIERFLQNRKDATSQELVQSGRLEQVGAFLLATHMRLGSVQDAPFAKRRSTDEVAALDVVLKNLSGSIELSSDLVARHPGVSAVGMQRLLEEFRKRRPTIDALIPSPVESSDAYARFVEVMRLINSTVYPAFDSDKAIGLYALVVVEWMRGLSLATIIRKRIEYHQRRGQTPKLSLVIRSTMELIEQIARFRAPKYVSSYIDVLNVFLREIGREPSGETDVNIALAMEFGVSSRTLISLMELGLSRMSSVALFEKIADDTLTRDQCVAWVQEHNGQLDGLDIPAIIVREIREVFAIEILREENGN